MPEKTQYWNFPNVGNTDIDTYSKLDHEGVYNAADHSDEVKGVPVVFEIALEENQDETCLSKYVHVHLELSKAFRNCLATLISWQGQSKTEKCPLALYNLKGKIEDENKNKRQT